MAQGEPAHWHVCCRCGDRIGVYELAWLEHDDGTLISSSLLNIAPAARRGLRRAWHAGCAFGDFPPESAP
jgi:hypothetical protein